ncbi:four helix bundle protein [Robertkochia marina]|uniref:Four helix bundle protein n=1 Tax=Robertkochia marina TaxID=1227945 RepID=A0A4S3M2V9_9FLAO|nr:four helix bundle protein [Robertkochia marina]THD69210.1 four helix bundle protein [Robertkochia marina]TRZ47531.1 four helix bundle protein [Robertkochia marina]
MFIFEKLEVYNKAKSFNLSLRKYSKRLSNDPFILDQLNRGSFSILLNISEGSGRITPRYQAHFYTIARGSTLECASILDYLKDADTIEDSFLNSRFKELDEISRMLFAMIRTNRIKHKDGSHKAEWG